MTLLPRISHRTVAAAALMVAGTIGVAPGAEGAATCSSTPSLGQCALFYSDLQGKPRNTVVTIHRRSTQKRSVVLTGQGHLDATDDPLHRWHRTLGTESTRTFYRYWRGCVKVQGGVWRCTPWMGAG